MINTLYKSLIFSILILGLGACELVELDSPTSEDEVVFPTIDGPTTVPSEESALLQLLHNGSEKTWSAMGFTLFGLQGFQSCRLDDVITINSNGTFMYDGGEQLCGAEDNTRRQSGTWRVDAGSRLMFEAGDRTYTAIVDGIDAENIVLSGEYIGLALKGHYTAP